MTFDELLSQITDLLQRQGRVSYGALKRRYSLDDAYLQDLKDELIDAQRVAADEGGKILVWMGTSSVQSAKFNVQSSLRQPPALQLPTPDPQSSEVKQGTWNVEHASGERRQLTV